MTYPGRIAAMLLGLALFCSCTMAGEEPSAAAAIMQAARAAGKPVGMVLRDGNDLCGTPKNLPDSSPDQPLQRLRLIADAYGYNVDATGSVVQVRPNGGEPALLEETLHHLWTTFPAQDSVMHTMGMVLTGWMRTAAGAKGWGISSGSSPEDPVLHLPAGENETSEQVANRIVSLGSKGGWVAWQSARRPDGSAGVVQLVTLSYLKYDNIDAFRCGA